MILPAYTEPQSHGRRINPSRREDDPPAPPRRRPGRPRDVLPAEALAKTRAAGGKLRCRAHGIGRLLGNKSKTASNRLLHDLASAGLVRLNAGLHGFGVARGAPGAGNHREPHFLNHGENP